MPVIAVRFAAVRLGRARLQGGRAGRVGVIVVVVVIAVIVVIMVIIVVSCRGGGGRGDFSVGGCGEVSCGGYPRTFAVPGQRVD